MTKCLYASGNYATFKEDLERLPVQVIQSAIVPLPKSPEINKERLYLQISLPINLGHTIGAKPSWFYVAEAVAAGQLLPEAFRTGVLP